MTLRSFLERFFGKREKIDISFVVPFFASHEMLDACLNSIAQHCTAPHEVLVIDDGNVAFDFTEVKKRPHLRVVHMPANRGPGACRNAGIKAARGTYIQFIDSDDEIIGDPAAYITAAKKVSPERLPDIITGHLADINKGRRRNPDLPRLTSVQERLGTIKMACFTAHLYRTTFLKAERITFPTDTRTAEDTVFLARALPRAASILETNIAIYRYNEVDESLSRLPVTLDLFRQRFETAGLQIAEALAPYPAAQATKCSVIFKYGVAQVKRHPHIFKEESAQEAFRILADLTHATDLVCEVAHEARKSAPVYWDDTFDRCVHLLKTGDAEMFFKYISETDIRIFKGEKKRQQPA